jgi:hypothetical protein
MNRVLGLFLSLALLLTPFVSAQDKKLLRGAGGPPAAVGGAPTVDASTTQAYTSTNPSTSTHTCSGSNRYLIVIVHIDSSSSVTSVTYNGVSLALIQAQNPPGSFGRTEMWGLVAPATGSNTVSVNVGANPRIVSIISFNSVNQSTPTGTPVSAQGATTPATVTASSATGEIVVAGITLSLNANETITAGGTEITNVSQSGTVRGASQYYAGSGSVVTSWTVPNTFDWSVVAIALKP